MHAAWYGLEVGMGSMFAPPSFLACQVECSDKGFVSFFGVDPHFFLLLSGPGMNYRENSYMFIFFVSYTDFFVHMAGDSWPAFK